MGIQSAYRLTALSVAVIASALFATHLHGQGRLDLSGFVVDASGSRIPGADVFVRSASSGFAIAGQADSEGVFSFQLRPGRYHVSAALTDFETASAEVDLADGPSPVVELRMVPAMVRHSVIVSASRERELAEDAVAKVDLVSRSQMLDSGYERVSDILSEEPGIVVRSGSSGSRSETQIQGLDSRQSLILLDGYPVVGARGIKRGILNMDRQSTNRLERIEIVKGASSALHGSDAIAGVINMITREPRRRYDGNVTSSGGSLGAFDARADTGFVSRGWSGFLGAERHQREAYDLTPGTIDTTSPRFRRHDFLAKLTRDFGQGVKLSMLANAFVNQDQGSLIGETGPTATVTDDSAQNYGVTLSGEVTATTQALVRGYYGKYDESSRIDVLGRGGFLDETANLNERLYRLEGSLSQVIGSRQLLQGGVEWTQNQYRGYNRLVGDNEGRQVRLVDAWLHDSIQAHPRISVTVGGRLNSHSLYGTQFVPRAGLLARVTDALRLRINWGRGFRAPDLGQLYFRFQNPTSFYQVIGNPLLAPETSSTTQAGFDLRLRKIRFGATYYRNDVKNLIQADLIGRPTTPEQLRGLLQAFEVDSAFNPGLHRLFFLYRNIQNVYTAGVEGRVEVSLTRNLAVSSAYTYLDARDEDTGEFLSQRHRHHGNLRLLWSTQRWGGLRTNVRGTYFSSWPIAGRSGSFTGNAYQVWDWYAAKPLWAGTEAYVTIDNLLDSVDSNLSAAQPTFFRADPGRIFRVGLRWSFGTD